MDVNQEALSWVECQDYCNSLSSEILCVENLQIENNILNDLVSYSFPSVWLSYNDSTVEGDLKWATGCSSDGYTNWDSAPIEPNGGLMENCGELYGLVLPNSAGGAGTTLFATHAV